MTLRISDRQSESDLDSISCDAFYYRPCLKLNLNLYSNKFHVVGQARSAFFIGIEAGQVGAHPWLNNFGTNEIE